MWKLKWFLKFRKSPYKTSFDPDATYLLVGCLGGLGQLYSRWMVDRGARNLTYLSRSGVAKAEIRDFIAEIENRGVIVHVVKGDVTNLEDVKRAVACSGKSVKGVVQAALTLQVFSIHLSNSETLVPHLRTNRIGSLRI